MWFNILNYAAAMASVTGNFKSMDGMTTLLCASISEMSVSLTVIQYDRPISIFEAS
jgi:hypothetical protein